MGEVFQPGTYALSSFSTVFHALYRACLLYTSICLIELFPESNDLFNISVHLPFFVKDNDFLTYFQSDTKCNGILLVLGINHLDIFELAEFAQKILVLSYIKQKGQ